MHRLAAHPALPPRRVQGVQVRLLNLGNGELLLRWRINGAQEVVLPPEAGRQRADDLWKTTCFELFVDRGGESYREFNFSPSGCWAVYDFSSYRHKESNPHLPIEPRIEVHRGQTIIAGAVWLPVSAVGRGNLGSLCAVIDEGNERLSFWSNRHTAEKPDFHDAACRTLQIAAPEVA